MKSNYHILRHGKLKREENTLKFIPKNEDDVSFIPVNDIESIFVHSELDMNSRLINFLDKNNIQLHFYSWNDYYTGSYSPTKPHLSGSTLIEQVEAYNSTSHRIEIAKEFVQGSIHNMRRNLLYYDSSDNELREIAESLENISNDVNDVADISEVLGKEAESRKKYYTIFHEVTPTDFSFTNREYNPPIDELNALISYGNSLLYSSITSAIQSTALDTTISYLHEPSDRRHSLSLDIADIFKPVIVDRFLLRLINRKQIRKEDHFRKDMESCLLNEDGRKIVLKEYEEILDETIEHPDLDRHVSYQYLLQLEVYSLKKHLLANEEYNSFRRWW